MTEAADFSGGSLDLVDEAMDSLSKSGRPFVVVYGLGKDSLQFWASGGPQSADLITGALKDPTFLKGIEDALRLSSGD